jgi:uncharacterized phage protein gp47/JayE
VPWNTPTLSELVDRIRDDFRGRLQITGALVRRAMADVFALVWSGAVYGLHGHIAWAVRQLFALTADREQLIIIGAMYGLSPTPAQFATGSVEVTSAAGSDVDVPAGTVFVRDDGETYTADALVVVPGTGTASVAVTAENAGEAPNTDAGETLQFESPIGGLDSTVTIEADADGDGIAGGLEVEETEDFRDRVLLRLREPPTGGSDQDYEAWALEVAGVTRAWVYRYEDASGTQGVLGTVTVRFVRDNDTPSIFPDAGEIAEVQTKLDEERPTTAEVTAKGAIELATPFTLSVTPNTAAVQAAVNAELDDLFRREGEPGNGAGRGTILLSQMRTAIGVAEGLTDYTLTSPAADVVPALGELATRGTMTYG